MFYSPNVSIAWVESSLQPSYIPGYLSQRKKNVTVHPKKHAQFRGGLFPTL
jgi:hypothetical protein